MKEKEDKLYSLQLILVCCLGLLTFIIPFLFLYQKDTSFIGDYGGFLSGVLGTIISIVTVILVYRTFELQKKELKLQREELKETREQLKKQQFETVFYKMLDTIYTLGRELKDSEKEDDFFVIFWRNMKYKYENICNVRTYTESRYINDVHKIEFDVIRKISEENENMFTPVPIKIINDGFRGEIEVVELEYMRKLNSWIESDLKNEESVMGHLYFELFKIYQYRLGHFFRYIYNTIKYIEQEIKDPDPTIQKEKREFYINLIQSQLSNYQLIIMFYNCISKISYNTKTKTPVFRDKLNDYEFFQNIPLNLFINPRHQLFYPDTPYKEKYLETNLSLK
jgi:hypothetical protein